MTPVQKSLMLALQELPKVSKISNEVPPFEFKEDPSISAFLREIQEHRDRTKDVSIGNY